VQFDGAVQTALLSDGVAVADPTDYEIRLYGADGALRTIARREWSPRRVTDQDVATLRSRSIDMPGEDGRAVPEGLRRQRAEVADAWVIASHMPAFSTMRVDATDHIWLRDFVAHPEEVGMWIRSPTEATGWTVFRPDGVLLGSVELPARFAPLLFGEDYVAGIYRDLMEVEYIHVYGLERGG
jgi:hypothetical protein